MQSQSNPQDVDPKDIGIVPEHEELVGYVYKRVVREVLARIDQRLAELEKHAASDAGEGQGNGRSREGFIDRLWLGSSRWAIPGSIGLVLTAALVGGTLAWRSSDTDPARSLISRLTPQFVQNLFSAKDSQDAAPDAAAAPAASQATADGAPAPAAAPSTPADAPASQAPSSPQQAAAAAQPQSATDNGGHDDETRGMAAASQELAPLIQKLSHDIANLGQGIEQLRHGQEQMGHDNALAIQQLQVGQDQLVRIMSKPAAQNAQAKPTTPAPAPQRATTAVRPRRPPAQQQPSLLFRRAT